MQFYDLPSSPWCQQLRIVLAEKGLAFERHIVLPGQELEPWFQGLNPLGRTPVLVERDVVVREAAVIAEYLDEAYPDHPLLPKDPRERAVVRIMVSFVEQYLGPPLEDLLSLLDEQSAHDDPDDPENASIDAAEADTVTELEADCVMALELLEALLSEDLLYAASKRYSLADAALLPFLLGTLPACQLEERINALPLVAAYCKRLSSRPSTKVIAQALEEWHEMQSTLD